MTSSLWLWAPTLVVLAAVLAGVWGTDPCAKYANGCSTPFHMPMFYKTAFTPSCNKHDVCYRCGAACGISKDQCDSTFLQNMNAVCAANDAARRRRHAVLGLLVPGAAHGRETRSACTVVAKNMFYESVHIFGSLFYHDVGDTFPYCSEPDVRGCLGL